MHAGKTFGLLEAILWTRRAIFSFVIISTIPTVLYSIFDIKQIGLPWVPIALIGTAVAFLIGFKNNATYDRLWEARKIWGAIINSSRTWGIMSRDFVTNRHADKPLSMQDLKALHSRLIYRHLAWVNALRYQLRQPRAWESMTSKENSEYKKIYTVPEEAVKIEDVLSEFLDKDELEKILKTKNPSTHLIANQSAELKTLLDKGLIEDFRHMEMENLLKELYDHQGKSERIKNFPYPRQFATLNLYFVWLFLFLIPFGMLPEFQKLGEYLVWLTIPFSTLVSWVFHTMEKIGEATENPFQGGANDIPMAALSRTIEIDLKEMLGEKELPEPLTPTKSILM
ncbi:MAG: bestrophin family ion channel [Cyclobacteriaceae bacterium]